MKKQAKNKLTTRLFVTDKYTKHLIIVIDDNDNVLRNSPEDTTNNYVNNMVAILEKKINEVTP